METGGNANPPGAWSRRMQSWLPLWDWRWVAVIVVWGAATVALWLYSPTSEPNWLHRAAPAVTEGLWHRFVAIYLGTALVSHVVIQPVTRWMRRRDRIEIAEPWEYVVPVFAGALESMMYITSWVIGRPEFMAFWVTLKVAGSWQVWNEKTEGRRRFQVFLTGNGLQIVFASLGFSAAVVAVLKT